MAIAFTSNGFIVPLKRPYGVGSRTCNESFGLVKPIIRSAAIRMVNKDVAEDDDHKWYVLHKRVMPADTDYSGGVWHGTYFRYFEEARVQQLHAYGLAYGDLVARSRLEIPVVEVDIKYWRAALLHDDIIIRQRLERNGRLKWDVIGEIYRESDNELLCSSVVTLVFVNMDTKLPARRIPPEVLERCESAMRLDEV